MLQGKWAIVRTMPRDVTCHVCKGPTRNAVTVKSARIAGFVCDDCLKPLPFQIKRV
jgi:hypothetical protein